MKDDARHSVLVDAAKNLLSTLPSPKHMVFHLELFQVTEQTFALCEVAVRSPGGSIGMLIDEAENGTWAETEFLTNLGYDAKLASESDVMLADMLVPRPVGRLVSIPSADKCPIPAVAYIPFGKPGDVYQGFSIGKLNTLARFVIGPRCAASHVSTIDNEHLTPDVVLSRLRAAETWLKESILVEETVVAVSAKITTNNIITNEKPRTAI